MKTTFHILEPDGRKLTSSVDWPEQPTFAQMRELISPLIGGGDIEHVWVTAEDGSRISMFVDEIGMHKRLAINPQASVEYRRGWLKRRPQDNPDDLPPIYGPAVLFDRRVWY